MTAQILVEVKIQDSIGIRALQCWSLTAHADKDLSLHHRSASPLYGVWIGRLCFLLDVSTTRRSVSAANRNVRQSSCTQKYCDGCSD